MDKCMDKQVVLYAMEKSKGRGIGHAWRRLQFEIRMLLAGLTELMTFE